MGSSVNIALPSIDKDFSLDAVALGWMVTIYILAAAIFAVIFGRLGDIYGRKKVFLGGLILYFITSVLSALAPSGLFLIIFRGLQGIGAAMIFSTAVAILASVFPAHERGSALGINVAAVYIGLSLGPVLGGLLTQYFGWRSIFAVNALLGCVVIVMALWKLKGEWAESRGERFDGIGSVLYGLALAILIYGLTLLPSWTGAAFIFAGLAGLVLFVHCELRTKNPVLNVNLFRNNTVFLLSSLAALVNYSATTGVGLLLSLYLQYVQGLGPSAAGLIMVSQPFLQAVLSPFAGKISDRIEPRVVASLGMTLTTISLIMLIFVSRDTSLVYIIINLMILGTGFALFSSPNTNAIMRSVERKFYGVASATVATMRLIGQMMSLGIVTLLFALFIGRVQITADTSVAFMDSYKMAFIIFAVLCAGGIIASLRRGNTR